MVTLHRKGDSVHPPQVSAEYKILGILHLKKVSLLMKESTYITYLSFCARAG